MGSWIFQKCADYTTWPFIRLMINKWLSRCSIHVLSYALSSPRTNRGPAAAQPRLPSSDSSQDEYQRCRPHAVRSTYPWRLREMIHSLPADSIDVDRAALSERLASLVAPPLARVRFVIVKTGNLFAIAAACEPSQWLCQVSKEQRICPLWLSTWLMSGWSKIDSSWCT
jgi:hypothetical protein